MTARTSAPGRRSEAEIADERDGCRDGIASALAAVASSRCNELPAVTLRGDDLFELFRALSGRRSPAQVDRRPRGRA